MYPGFATPGNSHGGTVMRRPNVVPFLERRASVFARDSRRAIYVDRFVIHWSKLQQTGQ